MSNMSYCRFNNTSLDLDDCINAIQDRNISSEEERNKAKRMLKSFCGFLEGEGIIDGYDSDLIDNLIDECGEYPEDEDE